MKTIKDILNAVGASEKFTRVVQKPKNFNKVKSNIPMHPNYNQMADIIVLPETKEKYRYLLVVTDLASNAFDIEPLKSRNSAEVLKALQTIYTRKYLKLPYASLSTDGDTAFKSVFHKWLFDKNIYHKISAPYRHQQQGNVESLNKLISRLLIGYMNGKESETGRVFREWTDILPTVREELNHYRKINLNNVTYPNPDVYFHAPYGPKYKIGDIVHFKLDYPEDALGNRQNTAQFRVGDARYSTVPKKIVKIFLMNDKPYYRYQLEGNDNVSFQEAELLPASKKEKESKYKVKKIIGKRTINGKVNYLVWWEGYKKDESTYEPKAQLIEDGLQDLIDEYEDK